MRKDLLSAAAGIFLLGLILTGCPDSPGEPPSVGSITVSGIPRYTVEGKASYKIYVSASNEMDDTKPHVAQGTKDLEGVQFENDKATVTIDLYAPPAGSGSDPDPDDHGDPWSGTANYFAVTISPASVSSEADIKVKAGTTLDASTQNAQWGDLMDLSGSSIPAMSARVTAIYERIICKDKLNAGTGITVE